MAIHKSTVLYVQWDSSVVALPLNDSSESHSDGFSVGCWSRSDPTRKVEQNHAFAKSRIIQDSDSESIHKSTVLQTKTLLPFVNIYFKNEPFMNKIRYNNETDSN